MKILEHRHLSELSPAKVQFLRIDPEDISITLSEILHDLYNMSWLENFDVEFKRTGFALRAKKTIDDIEAKFSLCSNDNCPSQAKL